MYRLSRLIPIAALAGLLSTPAFAQKRAVTIDDVMQLKGVAGPAVSPDGTQVLYTVRQWEPASEREKDRFENRTRIWMVPVAGGAARQVAYGERGDSAPQWSPDGRYISFLSARGAGTPEDPPRAQIYLMRTDGGEAWKLTDAKEGVTTYSWAPNSRRLAYVSIDPRTSEQEADLKRRDDERVFEGDFRYAQVWTIDVESKASARVTDGTAYSVRGTPSWAPDSQRLVFAAGITPMLRDYRSDVYIADTAAKRIDRISTNPGQDQTPQWSPDGAWIAWQTDLSTAKPIGDGTLPSTVGISHLVVYDVAKKTLKDVSAASFDTDAGAPSWTADSKRILFSAGARTATDVFSFDLATGRYLRRTTNRTVQLGSRSRDGRVVAVTMDTPSTPSEVYATDTTFATFRKLTDANPQAANFALGEAELVTWKNDGLDVEGVLLKPVGYEPGKRYPLLVVAHGGPAGAYTNNYRVGGLEGGQFWAGQGWAVFYPNPRGSTNYGEKFLRANINDWGGGDYRDIMTGVDALVARGIADPNRLAHIGWSYGGYMTSWVITQTNRFKAAMVGAGLTDMASMYGTNDIPNVLITYFGGMPNKETMALYSARSAMSHIENVTTPTLILHGASDERVPTGQAYELFRGLKDRGKTVELVFYPREGHGFTEYYHLKDRLTRIHAWVTKYTLGDAKTTTAIGR
jgi:dipeptidyl aminopeptidase/acylaminoacyl peptidase